MPSDLTKQSCFCKAHKKLCLRVTGFHRVLAQPHAQFQMQIVFPVIASSLFGQLRHNGCPTTHPRRTAGADEEMFNSDVGIESEEEGPSSGEGEDETGVDSDGLPLSPQKNFDAEASLATPRLGHHFGTNVSPTAIAGR